MWKILQQEKASDYVISTGKQYTVKQFVNFVLNELNINYSWKGSGINTKCYNKINKKIIVEWGVDANMDDWIIVECDKEYFRPLEVDTLLGDSRKAKKELNWRPTTNIKSLVKEMVSSELAKLNQ